MYHFYWNCSLRDENGPKNDFFIEVLDWIDEQYCGQSGLLMMDRWKSIEQCHICHICGLYFDTILQYWILYLLSYSNTI